MMQALEIFLGYLFVSSLPALDERKIASHTI